MDVAAGTEDSEAGWVVEEVGCCDGCVARVAGEWVLVRCAGSVRGEDCVVAWVYGEVDAAHCCSGP